MKHLKVKVYIFNIYIYMLNTVLICGLIRKEEILKQMIEI